MSTGKIKFFNESKGYGFITQNSGDEDIFFHISEYDGDYDPREGDEVSYKTENSDRGLKAVGITA